VKHDKSIQWERINSERLDLSGTQVAVVGGTGGLGRALSRLMASRAAKVTVVGQTFRDSGVANIDFIQADLSLMSEAVGVAGLLPAESLDLLVLTTGIFAAPQRQETAEGLERDMAVSYLNRLVLLRNVAPRLGKTRPGPNTKPRVFIMGFPGTGQRANIGDLNFENSYSTMAAHMSTVAGNEALVTDSAQRYSEINFYGLNPGLHKTNIRSNMLGENSLKHRAMEWVVGLLTPSVESYAEHVVPLLVSPGIESRSGSMFDRKARAIMPSAVMTHGYVKDIIDSSEKLIARVTPDIPL
jgi:NAD(P)-dependent dehydrogenase (short-subunit alcohol dehydrogenase family)